MGYLANVNAIDVSNSNTPGVIDPTNPVGEEVYRVVAEIDKDGEFHFTLTNAYSGNNGRAAILNDKHGANFVYTAGNAGNGGNPQPSHVISGTGTQIMTPSDSPEIFQAPGLPTPVGSFNITQLGLPHDKIGKDTNFRGLTIHDNVIYLTKGSGGNGVNTVYFIDTTLAACPSTSATPGVGLPSKNAVLPTMGLPYVEGDLQTFGVRPYNMCIMKGFPATLNSTNVNFPFGLFFADDNTLYVADEGTGDATSTGTALSNGIYTAAAAEINTAASTTPSAGLQKWILNSASGSWEYVYTLQTGLNLGTPYTIAGYPTGLNTVKTGPKPNTLKPWAPATDGLRNIHGETNEGKVTIWGITSTVSGSGDQGADPNKLVKITDSLKNTDKTVALGETFVTVRTAVSGEVLRGVSAVPGSDSEDDCGDE
jgi:hypothetical protein